MDLDSMSRDELLRELLRLGFSKLVTPIPNHPSFKVGMYYWIEQTGNNELWVTGEGVDSTYMTFDECDQYFKKNA